VLSCDVIIWDDNTPLFCFSWKLHSLKDYDVYVTNAMDITIRVVLNKRDVSVQDRGSNASYTMENVQK
jgi:hypothetical protein